LVKIILLYDSKCIKCGAKAKFGCSSCKKPLCGRCISKEKKEPLNNLVVPPGLCRNCVNKREKRYNQGEFNPLSEAITIYVTDPSHKKKFELSKKD